MGEKKRKKKRESSDDVVMYLGGRETMAVFRNYSSLYASPLTPLDSVFRLILTEIYLFFALFTRDICTYVGLSTKSNQLTLNCLLSSGPQPKVER